MSDKLFDVQKELKRFILLLLLLIFNLSVGSVIFINSILNTNLFDSLGKTLVEGSYFFINSPSTLIIPKINLNADIESVGMDEEGKMDVPFNAMNAGWYKYGPKPGEDGNAVIDGHLDSDTGPAVFYDLDKLEVGDEIIISDNRDKKYIFKVVKKAVYEAKDFPINQVFGNISGSKLNLITCGGKFDNITKEYLFRTVIYSELMA